MAENPSKALKIATIFSYGANEEEQDGILDEENPEDTTRLDSSSRDFWRARLKIITLRSERVTIRRAINSKIIIKTFLCE